MSPNDANLAYAAKAHRRLLEEALGDLKWNHALGGVIDRTINLACANKELTLELLEASEVAKEKLEALVVALRLLCGKPPHANKIVLDVAQDVVARIEAAREKLHYGFFSSEHADRSGYIMYLMADGTITGLTNISASPSGEGYVWPDKALLGRAVAFVESFRHDLHIKRIKTDHPIKSDAASA